jgi:Flp pilus assembly protein CpaB
MRGGRILLIVGIIGVVLAVIVGVILIAGSLQKPTSPPSSSEQGTPVTGAPAGMREIVVAAQKIPRGHLITEEEGAVQLALWPEEAVPDGALYELEIVYGRIARVDIVPGMPIMEDMLTEDAGDLAATGSDAALLIPSGKVGYALAVAGNASVAWAIQPGDHVDVLISLLVVDIDEDFQTETPNIGAAITVEAVGATGPMGRLEMLPDGTLVMVIPSEAHQRPRLVTQLTVQNAQVLHIGSWVREEVVEAPKEESTEEETPAPAAALVRWITLAVTPQEAAVLKYAEEVGASIDFVLRSASDHDERTVFTIQAVTLQYVFERYSIEAPPKLPYGASPPYAKVRPGATGEVVREKGPAGTVEYSRLGEMEQVTETTPAE